jgi:ribosomal protein S27AE
MDFGSILLILALAVLVSVFISRPFLTRMQQEKLIPGRMTDQEKDHRRSVLMAEHERVLNALQELEFDASLGKIPEEDYPLQRAALLRTGADTLRQLDEIQPESQRGTAEARIEAAVAARRGNGSQSSTAGLGANTSDDVENLIAARRREREERSAGFCPKCGKPVQKSDKFCSRCGTTIS